MSTPLTDDFWCAYPPLTNYRHLFKNESLVSVGDILVYGLSQKVNINPSNKKLTNYKEYVVKKIGCSERYPSLYYIHLDNGQYLTFLNQKPTLSDLIKLGFSKRTTIK